MISPISLLAPSLGPDLSTAARKVQSAVGGTFSEMLGSVVSQGINNLRQSEQTGIKGIEGTAATQDVVDAVMAAERSLQTAISIRDKVVSAFQEISRMPI
jgi:flagellar hook-basal body complex protein FliE